MKRYRTNRVGKLLGFIYGMAFMLACTNETDVPFAGNYRSVELDVKMDVSGFQNPEATRSVNGPLPGDLGEEENAIHNIMAFQFDGTGNDDDPLVIMRYADSNLKDLKLGFMQPIGHEEKEQFIYFIANAGKQLQNFSGTYGQLKQQLIPVNNKGLADGIMLMSATLQTTIKAGNSISVRLVRKLAKINVSCTVEEGFSFTPVRLQLRNVPKSTFLMNTSETTPVTNGIDLQNYWSVTENITEGYTWYMPENLRAAGSASSEKEKTAEVNFEVLIVRMWKLADCTRTKVLRNWYRIKSTWERTIRRIIVWRLTGFIMSASRLRVLMMKINVYWLRIFQPCVVQLTAIWLHRMKRF